MASGKGNLGKTIVLLILIIIITLGGLMWFDYLGVVKAKKVFAPVYRAFGLDPQTSVTSTKSLLIESDLEEDRFAKRLEALDVREQELNKRENDIAKAEEQNDAVAKELEERKKSQDEREKTFNNEKKKYDDRNVNIEQIASNLTSMPPKTAVDQLLAMDDQDVIDIMRKTDEIALLKKSSSMVSVWLMNMPSERAAQIQRKMANKPESLN